MADSAAPYYGITLSGLNVGDGATLEKALDAALRLKDETGFNAVEVWMDGVGRHPTRFWPEQYDDALTDRMRAFCENFACVGVHLPFAYSDYTCINPPVAAAARQQILLAIDQAGALGAAYCVGHARFANLNRVTEDENLRLYADAARQFADRAGRFATGPGGRAMRYCMETCEFLDSPEKMVRIVAEAGHPDFRLTLDAGKMMVYASRKFTDPSAADYADGTPAMLAWLDEHAGLIGSTHLWDYEASPGRGGRILPGNGLCDIAAVVGKLVAAAYDGSYNLETSGDFQAEKTAIETLRRYLDAAGD